MRDYLQEIIEIVASVIEIRSTDILAYTTIGADLELDEIDLAEIAFECENAFGICIYNEEVVMWHTVQDIHNTVMESSTDV